MKKKLLKKNDGFYSMLNRSAVFIIAIFLNMGFFVESFAQAGETLSFDGNNDYVTLPVTVSGNYTKEAWINPSVVTGFPNIISGTATALFINNGQIAAGHEPGFGQLVDPTASLVPGTWYHVAVSYNATTQELKLYKNGVEVASAVLTTGYTEPSLEIGRFSGGNFFGGKIDEVRLWKTVRTAVEISASMNCALTGDEPGLLAYYNFNQGIAGADNATINTLIDSHDDCIVYNGSLNNFALTGTTSNWVAPGPALTGTCSNSFPNISLSGNAVCIVNGDNTASSDDHTDFGNIGANPISRTFVIANTGNTSLTVSNISITGIDAADFTITSPTNLTVAAGATANLVIEFAPTGAQGTRNATVTITNNDSDEAAFNFAIAGQLIGPGKALAFDGINDKVDLNLAFSGSYTKEAWIKTNTLTGFPNILSGDPGTGTALFLNNGRLAAGHAASGFTDVLDATPLLSGVWYHVAVTYNAANNEMNLYKDGVLVASNTSAAGYTETLQQIGTFAGENYFNGTIDEVRIWNIVRTPGEIFGSKNCELNGSETGLIAYYNFNQGVQGANNSGVTTLNDLHGNCPLNGTLTGFALNGSTSNWVADGGTLSGSCTAQVPNISVAGNGQCVIIGDATPSTADNTDFGMVAVNDSTDKVFVITNNGGATLSISNITITGADASSFTLVSTAPATIFPGESKSFMVRFMPQTVGIKNASIIVSSNDSDESAYNFAIRGEATNPTPVSLLYFRAKAGIDLVKLTWETTAELNNAGFEIQRSSDGRNNWERIGYVTGLNRVNGGKYFFDDPAPLKGLNAYRLLQLDIDGRGTFSAIDVVQFAGNKPIVQTYPNPVAERLTIVFNDPTLLNTNVKISSSTGVTVATVRLTAYRQQVDMSSLSRGLYFIRFTDGSVQRVVKK